jgi:hypothetical protein
LGQYPKEDVPNRYIHRAGQSLYFHRPHSGLSSYAAPNSLSWNYYNSNKVSPFAKTIFDGNAVPSPRDQEYPNSRINGRTQEIVGPR